MPPVLIIKANGQKAPFDAGKIRATLERIGSRPETAAHVLAQVTSKVKDGMTTAQVYALVRRTLRKEDRCAAHRYNLRKGLLRLGPAGFTFEKYVSSILEAYGYVSEVPPDDLAGLCVKHEIDVVARKDGRIVMIEAKFRNKFEDTVTLKDAMSTWARYQDLRDGAKKKLCPAFTDAWIVTNGRFSDRAQQFCDCKGIRTVGWNDQEHSLARMVDHQALYPITVIDELKQWELDAFAKRGLVLCRQIAEKSPSDIARRTGVPQDRAASIVRDCKEIVKTR